VEADTQHRHPLQLAAAAEFLGARLEHGIGQFGIGDHHHRSAAETESVQPTPSLHPLFQGLMEGAAVDLKQVANQRQPPRPGQLRRCAQGGRPSGSHGLGDRQAHQHLVGLDAHRVATQAFGPVPPGTGGDVEAPAVSVADQGGIGQFTLGQQGALMGTAAIIGMDVSADADQYQLLAGHPDAIGCSRPQGGQR